MSLLNRCRVHLCVVFVSGALRWVTRGRSQPPPSPKGRYPASHHTRHLVPTSRAPVQRRSRTVRPTLFAFPGSRRHGLSGHARASPDRGFTTQCTVLDSQPATTQVHRSGFAILCKLFTTQCKTKARLQQPIDCLPSLTAQKNDQLPCTA